MKVRWLQTPRSLGVLALCRQTRQIVACFVGDRSADAARPLRARIPPSYRCRATGSDLWLACDEIFPGAPTAAPDQLIGNHYYGFPVLV